MYSFYADTFHRHGHEPYLNLDFFKRIAAAMPDELMLKVARMGDEPIAVAIFFVGSDALFGRYWGAGGNFHSLHFEACYYQGIEYCIEKRLQRFEPGTQGRTQGAAGIRSDLDALGALHRRPTICRRHPRLRRARGARRRHLRRGGQSHVPYHRAPDEELRL